jgi:ATP-dependent RNA helicase DDX27
MLREEIAEENLQPMVDASVRAAKKAHRPRAMGEPEPPKRADKTKTKKKRSSTSALKVGKQGGGFARDLGERSGEARSGGGGGGGGGARKKAGGGPLGGKPGKGGARSKGKSGRKR